MGTNLQAGLVAGVFILCGGEASTEAKRVPLSFVSAAVPSRHRACSGFCGDGSRV